MTDAEVLTRDLRNLKAMAGAVLDTYPPEMLAHYRDEEGGGISTYCREVYNTLSKISTKAATHTPQGKRVAFEFPAQARSLT